jgi:hypothetical protein
MGITFGYRTTDYEFANGHGPRGEGAWAFEIVGAIGVGPVPEDLRGAIFVPWCHTYTDAKKHIQNYIKTKMQANARYAHIELNVLT